MTKPFDIKELLARITAQLRKNEIQTEKHSLSIGDLSGLSMNVPKDSIYGFVKKNDAGNLADPPDLRIARLIWQKPQFS